MKIKMRRIKLFLQIYHQKLVVNFQQAMKALKFKQIRKSIITQNQPEVETLQLTKSPIRKKLFAQYQNNQDLSFKSIKQRQSPSPLKQLFNPISVCQNSNKKYDSSCQQQFGVRQNLSPLSNKKRMLGINQSNKMYIYDSEKKKIITNFGSDQKQNYPHSLYYNRNEDTQSSILNFAPKVHKVNTSRMYINTSRNQQNSLYETTKTPTPGSLTKKFPNMSFKTLIQTSNKKRNKFQSQRANDRQSSLSKLKDRLFGMKKIISERDPRDRSKSPTLERKEELQKKQSIYTKKDEDTEYNLKGMSSFTDFVLDSMKRQSLIGKTNSGYQNHNCKEQIFNNIRMNDSHVESVNMSIAQSQQSFLDMSPHI